MFPDLFSIGPIHLHSFGLMLACGFLSAFFVVRRTRSGDAHAGDYASNLLVCCMAGGVLGARLAYVVEHWESQFRADPGAIFRIDQGGLMYYGGLIGAMIALAIFAFAKKEPLLEVFDRVAVALPLGQAFGRVGCFLNGCCHGRVSAAYGIPFPARSPAWWSQLQDGLIAQDAPRSLPVIPTQLFETAGCVLLFFVLWKLRGKGRTGLVTGAYLAGYGILRFFLEYLRGDERFSFGALSISQAISLAAIAASIPVLRSALASRPKRPGP